MESWRKVFRDGLAPQFSAAGLEALRKALLADDPRLLQGATTSPPPLAAVQDWPVEGADIVTFPFWIGDGLETVGECESVFAKACYECDNRLGEPTSCRWLLNWWDGEPRSLVVAQVLAEVNREIAIRAESAGEEVLPLDRR